MPSASVTVRMDEDLKKQAEMLYEDMGLNMTTAITMFTKAVVRQRKIPFEIAADPFIDTLEEYEPNEETIEAMREADRISRDPNVKSYTDVDEMMREILADV